MEVGENDKKKVESHVPWLPTTPFKPILPRPVPIYPFAQEIQMESPGNGVPSCFGPSAAAGIHRREHRLPPHHSAVTNVACDSDSTRVRVSFDGNPSSGNGFAQLLAGAETPSAHSHAGILNNSFVPAAMISQFNPAYMVIGPHHLAGEQPLFSAIHHNYQDPQGTSCLAYYCKTAPQVSPPAPDNGIRAENTQYPGMQCNVEEKDRGRAEKHIPAEEHNSTLNKELCDPSMHFASVSTPCKENHSQKELSHHIDLNETPQPKPPRRRKHRPKVIKEDKPKRNRTPATPKPVQSKENPTGKRRYSRKKVSDQASTPHKEVTQEWTKPVMSESDKKTCRRPLNFDVGEQQRDENSACFDSGTGFVIKETPDLNNKETQAPSTPLSKSNAPTRTKSTTNPVDIGIKGKALMIDQDDNENREQILSGIDTGILIPGIQVVGSKRKHSSMIEHKDISNTNQIGTLYNILQAHYPEYWIQFPNVQKKKRSEKGKNCNTSNASSMSATKDVQEATCPQEEASPSPYASSPNFRSSGSEHNAVRVPIAITTTGSAIHDKPQSFECDLSLGKRTTKRRSRVSTRKTGVDADRQHTGIDALVAEMRATLTKKKRTKKRSTLVTSAYNCTNEIQNHVFLLQDHTFPLDNSTDVACEEIWNKTHNEDALSELFRQLSINREAREPVLHGQSALVPYNPQNQKHKGLAHGFGPLIPYEGSFDPIKKQRPRPKVDLDEETNRVWKLLLLDINSHGIDGMDEAKAKWWEEERNVFRGRADSFIARMHLVQGDRRFSPWKGSVVDSVIGVFLTQNVSDHLSSSAFMSLAARFPLKSSLIINNPQVYIAEVDESTELNQKLSSPSVHDLNSVTIEIIEHSEEKEPAESNDSCRTTGTLTSLTDESNFKLLESISYTREQHSPVESGPISAMTGEGQENCSDGRELNEMVSSQCSVITSQICADFSVDQSPEKMGSSSESNSEVEDLSRAAKYNIFCDKTSFSKLLEMASSTTLHEVSSHGSKSSENLRDAYKHGNQTENLEKLNATQNCSEASTILCDGSILKITPEPNSGVLEVNCYNRLNIEGSSTSFSKNKDENSMKRPNFPTAESDTQAAFGYSQSMASQLHLQQQSNCQKQNALNISGQTHDSMQKASELDFGGKNINENSKIKSDPTNLKGRERRKEKRNDFDWDSLRIQAQAKAGKREKTANTMDSVDWDAVRCADVKVIADAIKERGMNNMLAERIKNFLNLLVDKHGAIDLEWLRDVPPDQAKEYLLSIRGLGLKSVECVRLLTMHHLAFPVDTNVGRIAVRLGWVPLQPLPESLQLHLLELYPVLESIQKYLWPRLCKLDSKTLYELHYQLITFGKVFCTKQKPNCNACPMRGECRHFASAFASARFALPGPEQRSIVIANRNNATDQKPSVVINQLPLPLPADTNQAEVLHLLEVSKQFQEKSGINNSQPIIEEPASPEPECLQVLEDDMEDAFNEEPCKIPLINVDLEEFTLNVKKVMEENMELQEGEMSKALVAITPEAACIPTPKLKNVNRLRTEHWVYELPDSHPLLEGWEKREADDPGKYLLAIWTPGETANSIQPPDQKCSSHNCDQLCDDEECFPCNSLREANSQIVRGTILIPCRTAMRGSFPLNGTYFQVNEVFADDESSLNPISVPRNWIWNLNRRTVYFGTSVSSIFKGLSTQEIQRCFWRGYVCVRGFDRETRAPRPLKTRLHCPPSKLVKKESTPAMPQELNLNLQPNPEQPELIADVPHHEERGGA